MACKINCEELMAQITQCEFILIDINLYLDTHPGCERAISDYNCYAQQLHALKKLYDENCGPLQNFGNSINNCDSRWLYAYQPFPWQTCKTEVN